MKPTTKAASGGEPKKKKQQKPAVKFVLTVTKILMVFIIALTCTVSGILGGAILGYIKTAKLITPEQLNSIKTHQSTIIYDVRGNEIAKLTGSENKDSIWVDDKDIPKTLKNAYVALEDERFYKHNGFDLMGFLRAATKKILNPSSTEGGSTITMQLYKKITGEESVTLQRKVQQQWGAIQLEKNLQKWQILELYLNIIPLGGNSYGVQSASYKYFGKPVSQLDLAECATIAAITQTPNALAPVSEKSKARNKARQEICLKKMYEQGMITQDEYNQALNEKLKFAEEETAKPQTTVVRSYFVDQVIKDVLKNLKQMGYTDQFASLNLYNGGWKIYTTLDPDVQGAMDEVFKDEKDYFPGKKNSFGELPQASMAIIDPKTGQVKAMYGGRGEKTGDSVLNRATQSQRQAGSSFKPVAVYGPAIDQRLITAATVQDDVPVYMLGQNKARYPENYPEAYEGKSVRVYRGLTDTRTAISHSINVIAAKTFMTLGPDLSFKYIEKSGIDMSREDKVLSIAMGGLKYGVNTLNMAAAYVPFDHKGMYYEPITFSLVKDSEGKTILDKKSDSAAKQKSNIVYDEATAFIMTNLMQSVTAPGGTASYIKVLNANKQKVPVAGKTGTTNDDKDRWFMGYTPEYVGAVWYGYDTPTEIVLGKSLNPSAVIWQAVMQKVYSKINNNGNFQMPGGIVQRTICTKSGKIATALCAKDQGGSTVRTEYFIKGTEPKDTDVCDVHVTAKVDITSKDLFGRNLLANPGCPAASVAEKVFIRRKEPYTRIKPDDPFPVDFKFEVPYEYCNLHGSTATAPQTDPGSAIAPVVSPAVSPASP